jgi:hypothetical protein
MMVFDDKPLPARTHESAQNAGVRLGTTAHLVLWGQSYEYPDGVVVQAHLSTTPYLQEGREERPELWTMDIPAAEPIAIAVDLPRELYEFPPVMLSLDAAKHYQDLDGLVIYRDRAATQPIGRFRDIFRAYEYKPDAVLLESGGVRGWVPLPYVWREKSEIVDFTGGFIRLLRGDWAGARQSFQAVLGRESITPEMRVDAQLFLGLIAEKTGHSGLQQFRAAVELNEFDRAAARYLLMGLLADAARSSGPGRQQALAALRKEVEARAFLFPADGNWIPTLRRAITALEGGSR